MKTAFISGHLDLTLDEFSDHYEDKIRDAFHHGYKFVVGDAPGADHLAQIFLMEIVDVYGRFNDIKVFHMFDSSRNNEGFETVGGFTSDLARDKAMTLVSHFDIAWVRPDRESSGTQKNLERRK